MRSIIIAAATVAALIPATGGAAGVCAKPAASAPAFAQGSSNTLRWTVGSPNGSGFDIEVATEATLDADGSFKDSKVVQTASVGSSVRERVFAGLAERRFFYHLRTKGTTSCTVSAWSNAVATIQDATKPTIEITTTSPEPSNGVVIPAAFTGPVTIKGVVTDHLGTGAPAASGPGAAIVRVENTTPVLGAQGEPIPPKSFTTDVDGTWTATFTGLTPGLYVATATGVDEVGNESATSDTFTFVVTA